MLQPISLKSFSVEESDNGKRLRVDLIGPNLILIGSNKERDAIQAKKVATSVNIPVLNKFFYNCDSNPSLLKLSASTNTPIRNIPTIFFVVDGKIVAIYNKPININTMTQWFMEKIAKFTHVTKMSQSQTGTHDVTFKRRREDPSKYSMNAANVKASTDIPFIGVNAAWRSDQLRQ